MSLGGNFAKQRPQSCPTLFVHKPSRQQEPSLPVLYNVDFPVFVSLTMALLVPCYLPIVCIVLGSITVMFYLLNGSWRRGGIYQTPFTVYLCFKSLWSPLKSVFLKQYLSIHSKTCLIIAFVDHLTNFSIWKYAKICQSPNS